MFPVPAVNVVILSELTVAVDSVKPPPGFVNVLLLAYLNITTPEPPAPDEDPVEVPPPPPPRLVPPL